MRQKYDRDTIFYDTLYVFLDSYFFKFCAYRNNYFIRVFNILLEIDFEEKAYRSLSLLPHINFLLASFTQCIATINKN